jgi:hypothetical protein
MNQIIKIFNFDKTEQLVPQIFGLSKSVFLTQLSAMDDMILGYDRQALMQPVV